MKLSLVALEIDISVFGGAHMTSVPSRLVVLVPDIDLSIDFARFSRIFVFHI